MVKGPTTNVSEENAERTIEQAMHVGQYEMECMRQVMEQSLDQSGATCEGFLTTVRKTADSLDQQVFEIRGRSMSFAAETLSNMFNFARKAIRVREPQELVQLHNEFVSQQAQALAEQSKELGQRIAQGVNEVGRGPLGG
jgi:hypothetical protein